MKTKNRYLILRTAFHCGGIMSTHATLDDAEDAIADLSRGNSCTCGCFGIWDREVDGEPSEYTASGEHYSTLCA